MGDIQMKAGDTLKLRIETAEFTYEEWELE